MGVRELYYTHCEHASAIAIDRDEFFLTDDFHDRG
jgi:hypothetical protein